MDKGAYAQMLGTAVMTLVLFGAGAVSGFAAASWSTSSESDSQGVHLSQESGNALAEHVAQTTAASMKERMLAKDEVEASVKEGMIAFLKDRTGGGGGHAKGQGDTGAAKKPTAETTTAVPAVTAADHVWGPKDAPYTLIEYSDYECPYCARLHNEVLPKLKERMGDDLRIVYRHRPLRMHEPRATQASLAAECVASLNGSKAFWAYTDALYNAASKTDLVALGKQVGVDGGALSTCLDEERFAERVDQHKRQANELGIRGTPTMFLRASGETQARRLNGAQPAARIAQVFSQIGS